MARPTTHTDLSEYVRQGDVIFSWNHDLGQNPEVEQWIVKAKLEARKQGMEVGASEVRVPKTTDQLDAALKDAQDRWDNGEAQYAALRNGHCSVADLGWADKNAANFYASAEGLPSAENVVTVTQERTQERLTKVKA